MLDESTDGDTALPLVLTEWERTIKCCVIYTS